MNKEILIFFTPILGVAVMKFFQLDRIQRADNALSATVQHVGIDHRSADILMPKQVLHRTDIIARHQ
jgi:hypothetical protein